MIGFDEMPGNMSRLYFPHVIVYITQIKLMARMV